MLARGEIGVLPKFNSYDEPDGEDATQLGVEPAASDLKVDAVWEQLSQDPTEEEVNRFCIEARHWKVRGSLYEMAANARIAQVLVFRTERDNLTDSQFHDLADYFGVSLTDARTLRKLGQPAIFLEWIAWCQDEAANDLARLKGLGAKRRYPNGRYPTVDAARRWLKEIAKSQDTASPNSDSPDTGSPGRDHNKGKAELKAERDQAQQEITDLEEEMNEITRKWRLDVDRLEKQSAQYRREREEAEQERDAERQRAAEMEAAWSHPTFGCERGLWDLIFSSKPPDPPPTEHNDSDRSEAQHSEPDATRPAKAEPATPQAKAHVEEILDTVLPETDRRGAFYGGDPRVRPA
jgi:hypothetical protein